ncbi:MAG: sigma 54-interacting transcriptional regulator [Deltaproteobacteria bacterium]|jgi:PAS domain S-box-containing protein|nr:sigma 54-interacting transcriptional regulator [Deltaproteobacteria bacterium]
MSIKKYSQPYRPAAPDPPSDFPVNDILNSLPLGIIVLDGAGTIVHCNREAAGLLGQAPEKVTGSELSRLWPKSAADIAAALNGGRLAIGLVPSELDNCYIQVKPLSGAQGGAAVTIFDQRLWQPFLKTSQALDPLAPYYKEIFESSSDGISVVDSRGRLILMNEAAARQEGAGGEDPQAPQAGSPAEKQCLSEAISHDVLASGRPITRMARLSGSGRHVLLTGTPIFSPDGEVSLVVVSKRDLTELLELQNSIQKHKLTISHYKDELAELQMAELAGREVVAGSPAMSKTLETAAKIARYDARQILLTGESGTGKGLLAKFIHSKSKRAAEPLLELTCAALPARLLEAELFGYERGAFPGASPDGRAGLFEVAGKGTVYLDEIGEMPLAIQDKLLSFLDTWSFNRVAGRSPVQSGAAVIASSSKDLRDLMARKLFRSDLYFRLNVFSLGLPPLRERREDVAELARRELARVSEHYGVKKELDPAALEVLMTYPFPGNVRELLNSISQAVLLSEGPRIGEYLARLLTPAAPVSAAAASREGRRKADLAASLHDAEKISLLKALATCRNTREMAETLGISQAGVSRKLKKHGLPLPKNRSELLRDKTAPAPSEVQATEEDRENFMGSSK